MVEWFRRPDWADDWDAWRAAAREVAALEDEVLPWPYEKQKPSGLSLMMAEVNEILKRAEQVSTS